MGSFNTTPEAPPLCFDCDVPIYFATSKDFKKRTWLDKNMDLTPLLKKQNNSDILKPWHSMYDKDNEHPTEIVNLYQKLIANDYTKEYVLSKVDCDYTTDSQYLYNNHLADSHNVNIEKVAGNKSGGSGELASIKREGTTSPNIKNNHPGLKMIIIWIMKWIMDWTGMKRNKQENLMENYKVDLDKKQQETDILGTTTTKNKATKEDGIADLVGGHDNENVTTLEEEADTIIADLETAEYITPNININQVYIIRNNSATISFEDEPDDEPEDEPDDLTIEELLELGYCDYETIAKIMEEDKKKKEKREKKIYKRKKYFNTKNGK